MTLATSLRPQRFADVVGQNHIKPVLRAIVIQQNVPPAFVFAGPRGVGKTTVGRIFAAALNCENPDKGDCCTTCASCKSILDGNSTSVIEIDAASHGLVADIRKIREIVEYAHDSLWRVVLLDEAHSMSREAHNALLKTLEEPPEHTVFVLLTTEASKLPETVRSRSMRFDFRPHTTEDIVSSLRNIVVDGQDYAMDEDLLYEIARRAYGGLRDAMMMYEQAARVNIVTLDDFEDMFGLRDVSVELLSAIVSSDIVNMYGVADMYLDAGNASYLVDDMVELIRQLLVWQAGGEIVGISESLTSTRKPLAAKIPTNVLVKSMRILWEVQGRLATSEGNRRSAVLIGLTLLLDTMHPEPITTVESTVESQKRLTAEEMLAAVKAIDEAGRD